MNTINSLLKKGILVSPEIARDPILIEFLSKIEDKQLNGVVFIDKAFLISQNLLTKESLERQTSVEKDEPPSDKVNVLFSYNKEPGKITVNDFVAYFNRRFEALSFILRQRQELQKVTSISRIKNKTGRENVTILGLVYGKMVTKNNSIIITLEDPSGVVKVLVGDRKRELFEQAKEVVLDELIGVEGVTGGNFIIANQIFIPDIPLLKELKKGSEEECLALLGDPHFGSKAFLKKEFDDFIEWINQRKGSEEQKELASKIKYLVIIGDLVEGVGIYPDQEKDLEVKDVKEQYDLFAGYLQKIPQNISIIVCPGNHDAGRISEPQPPLLHKYAESLRKLPNVFLLSNPALVNIGATKEFSGFDLLLYHGASLIYYSNNVDVIRRKGGQKRPDLLMKLLLQMRHLAPTHTSNLYTPDASFDPLVINKIPDFFITGHIHRVSVSNYKNITLVNCSCWTGTTEDQEKRGLQPQPGRVPLVNLKTREVKVINFFRDEREERQEKQATEAGEVINGK